MNIKKDLDLDGDMEADESDMLEEVQGSLRHQQSSFAGDLAQAANPNSNPNSNPNPNPSPSPSPSPNPYPYPNPNPNPSPNQAAVLEAQRISELDALLPHLERINQWDVDVFALWEASENMGLVVGTYHLLEQHNLVSKFRLSKPRLMTFLAKMQEGYR